MRFSTGSVLTDLSIIFGISFSVSTFKDFIIGIFSLVILLLAYCFDYLLELRNSRRKSDDDDGLSTIKTCEVEYPCSSKEDFVESVLSVIRSVIDSEYEREKIKKIAIKACRYIEEGAGNNFDFQKDVTNLIFKDKTQDLKNNLENAMKLKRNFENDSNYTYIYISTFFLIRGIEEAIKKLDECEKHNAQSLNHLGVLQFFTGNKEKAINAFLESRKTNNGKKLKILNDYYLARAFKELDELKSSAEYYGYIQFENIPKIEEKAAFTKFSVKNEVGEILKDNIEEIRDFKNLVDLTDWYLKVCLDSEISQELFYAFLYRNVAINNEKDSKDKELEKGLINSFEGLTGNSLQEITSLAKYHPVSFTKNEVFYHKIVSLYFDKVRDESTLDLLSASRLSNQSSTNILYMVGWNLLFHLTYEEYTICKEENDVLNYFKNIREYISNVRFIESSNINATNLKHKSIKLEPSQKNEIYVKSTQKYTLESSHLNTYLGKQFIEDLYDDSNIYFNNAYELCKDIIELNSDSLHFKNLPFSTAKKDSNLLPYSPLNVLKPIYDTLNLITFYKQKYPSKLCFFFSIYELHLNNLMLEANPDTKFSRFTAVQDYKELKKHILNSNLKEDTVVILSAYLELIYIDLLMRNEFISHIESKDVQSISGVLNSWNLLNRNLFEANYGTVSQINIVRMQLVKVFCKGFNEGLDSELEQVSKSYGALKNNIWEQYINRVLSYLKTHDINGFKMRVF